MSTHRSILRIERDNLRAEIERLKSGMAAIVAEETLQMRAEIEGLRAENAELVAVLQALDDAYETPWRQFKEKLTETMPQVRAAIRMATAHFGDPCIYCGIAHDDVPVGPCKARVAIAKATKQPE